MPQWLDVGKDSFRAAQALTTGGRWRSSVSRAYYAAFSLVTDSLVCAGAGFANQETPKHQALANLVEQHLIKGRAQERRLLKSKLRTLYHARINADYRLGISTDRQTALAALADMVTIYQLLGVEL